MSIWLSEASVMSDTGISPAGSLRNQQAMRSLVKIVNKINVLGGQKRNPEEQVKIVRDTIAMIMKYCDIRHLRVKSAQEIFSEYFCHIIGTPIKKKECPTLTTDTGLSLVKMRVIPLYCSTNQTTFRVSRSFQDWIEEEYLYRLFYIDMSGKILCFTAHQIIEGDIIKCTHAVHAHYATDEVLEHQFSLTPVMFDSCMRTLIAHCRAVVAQTEAHLASIQRMSDALVMVTEEMRHDDLTLVILLAENEFEGMPGCETHVRTERFRALCVRAGSTPEERLASLEEQVKILKRSNITQISWLDLETTMDIINTWKIPAVIALNKYPLSEKEREEHTRTVEMFEVIVSDHPSDIQSFETLRQCYCKLGDRLGVLSTFKRAVQAYQLFGEYSSAILELEHAEKEFPDDLEIKKMLALMVGKTSDPSAILA